MMAMPENILLRTLCLLKLLTIVLSRHGTKSHDPIAALALSQEDQMNIAQFKKKWPHQMNNSPEKLSDVADYIIRLSPPSTGQSEKTVKKKLKRYRSLILAEQERIIYRLKKKTPEMEVITQTQLAINAIFVRMSSQSVDHLINDPSVERISQVGDYTLSLSTTVPSIGGDADVVRLNGLDGCGATVAVLDTGIDYTHKNFGGEGTIDAYKLAYSNHSQREGFFPTAKVVEGYDFVGEQWSAFNNVPLEPDDDPIEKSGNSHGTHVADIIAGKNGVAPDAYLVAIKVCAAIGGGGCNGVAIMKGIEFAIEQEVDIINYSIGRPYEQPFDNDVSYAFKNAHDDFGILVVGSAGNNEDKPYNVGGSTTEPTALSVAQTFTRPRNNPTLAVDGTDYLTVWFGFSVDWKKRTVQAPLLYGNGQGGNTLGCDPFMEGSLDGRIVMVHRGVCYFDTKIGNIEKGGGVAAIIINSVPALPPGANLVGDGVTIFNITALMIGMDDGQNIIEIYNKAEVNGNKSPIGTFGPLNKKELPSKHEIASTSSRGPDNSFNRIKPEIGAPGALLSAIAGSGNKETEFGGTSAAAPLVAGAAALIKQSCPTCTPLEVKSLLMNNADRNVVSGTTGEPFEISRIGAGRLRVDKALNATFWAYCLNDRAPSVSLGLVDAAQNVSVRKTIRVVNRSNKRHHLEVKALFRLNQFHESGAINVKIEQNGEVLKHVTLDENGQVDFDVVFNLQSEFINPNFMSSGIYGNDPSTLTANELDGYIVLKSHIQEAGLPWHVLARQAANVEAVVESIEDTNDSENSSLKKSMQISVTNKGTGIAQIDTFSILALSNEKRKGSAGENNPTPDIKAIGYRTVLTTECPSNIALQFAVSTWDRQRYLLPVTFYFLFDVDGDGIHETHVFTSPVFKVVEEDKYVYMSDPRISTWVTRIPPNATATSYPFNSQSPLLWFMSKNIDVNSRFFVDHATNTKNTILTICGDDLGLMNLKNHHASNINIIAYSIDSNFGGDGDNISAFHFSPKISNATNFDVPQHSSSASSHLTVPFDHESFGVMLVTNSYRGPGRTGAAVEDTEALLLLMDGVQPPQPLLEETEYDHDEADGSHQKNVSSSTNSQLKSRSKKRLLRRSL